MSLRAKLIWAFLVVALVALVPAALVLNVGLYRETMRMEWMHPYDTPRGHMTMPVPPGPQQRRDYLRRIWVWSLVGTAGAFAVAGTAGYWTAGRITRSLRHLRDAEMEMDLRDLSRRVPVEGNDEIADLARAFNHMCERLQAEEKARRQLFADVAHELRHPLAVLQGRMELMQEGKAPVDQESLLPLQDEVIRLTRLVGDLRDLSLAEVGGLSLHMGPVDIRALIDGLLVNMEPVAAAKEIQLKASVAPDLPVVQGDRDRLRQVVVNLLANAIQYTPEGGRVSLEAVRSPGLVVISIRDTGPGIAPADLPHIFDRFYRADKARSRATGGSGLGLAIVRSLVELHGGRVAVRSEPGQGSTFTVTLPAKPV